MKKHQLYKLSFWGGLLSITWVIWAAQNANTAAGLTNKGYTIEGKYIRFIYPSSKSAGKVYVIGNFMRWKRQHPAWQMKYINREKAYVLRVPINRVKQPGRSFYEFTFLVNNRYLDANKKASNVIHCVGYGYRYVIREL